MLDDQVPLGVIHPIIEICYRDLHSPVFFVVEFNMPVDSNWAHMGTALHKWRVAISTRAINSIS